MIKIILFVDLSLLESTRKRQITVFPAEAKEVRILLSKEWAKHKMKSYREEHCKLQVRNGSRQDALNELKKISLNLYNEAVKVNRIVYPLILNGPVETPPCTGYVAPDLDDINIKQMKRR